MTTESFDVGDLRTLTGLFTDSNDAPADPSAITLTIREPDGTVTTKAIADLANPSVGTFTFDFLISQAGRHLYDFAGTAGIVSVGQQEFYARRQGAA